MSDVNFGSDFECESSVPFILPPVWLSRREYGLCAGHECNGEWC